MKSNDVQQLAEMKKLFLKPGQYILQVSLFLFSAFACNKSNPPGVNAQTSTISYVLANASNTTIFHSAVVKAGLDTVFNSPSLFTVFVPTDQACIQSGYSQTVINGFSGDQAKQWVLYQTYAGTVFTTESFIGKSEEKLVMADGDSIFVSGDSNRTFVNGFETQSSELTTSNGVLIALQNVLVPPTKNLEQLVNSDTSFTFLSQAINLASPTPDSLSTLLSTGGPFTFFAPDNDAFRKLGYNSPTDLNAVNPDSLRLIVLLSLIPQRLFSNDISDSSTFKTVSDSTLIFSIPGLEAQVKVLGSPFTSNIITINSMAINGVLFKIDELLDH
jgi:transforming growth factor-beta-induced protein